MVAKTPPPTQSESFLHRSALGVVNRVLTREGFTSLELYKAFKALNLPPADKQLVLDDVRGMLGEFYQVDFLLRQYKRLNVQGMPLELLNFLRFSAFLCLHGGKSRGEIQDVIGGMGPDFASKYGGFIDRVLNFLEKNAPRILAEDIKGLPAVEQIAIRYSFPRWVVDLWVTSYGTELAEELCRASNMRPSQDLRVNATRESIEIVQEMMRDEGIKCDKGQVAPHAITVPNGVEVFKTKAFQEKLIEVQDQGSQLVTYLVDPGPDDVVLDCCAGTGGKTLQLAGLFSTLVHDEQIRVYVSDISPGKLATLSKRVNRAYARPSHVKVIKQGDIPHLKEKVPFTKILVDAPCSGLGSLRRNPGIKATTAPTDASELVVKQNEILRDVVNLAGSGTRIIYVTCTIDPAENEELIKNFASTHGNVEILPYRATLSPSNPILTASIPTNSRLDGRFFMLYPPLTGTDGFFGAILRKTE